MSQSQPAHDLGLGHGHPLGIASTYRQIYLAKFEEDVLAGTKRPFILPLHMLGIWIIPTLYLAIPHKNRPWLYRARWLVLAILVAFNLDIILNVSSHNFGSAYAAGLVGSWSIVWSFALLVWTRPQWEAKRVNIRRKLHVKDQTEQGKLGNSLLSTTSGNGHAAAKPINGNQQPCLNGASHQTQSSCQNGMQKESEVAKASGLESNGHKSNGNALSRNPQQRKANISTDSPLSGQLEISEESRKLLLEAIPPLRRAPEINLDKLASEQEFEYYWQEYPEDGSFWARLDWAFDIASTFRMTGWNWAISCLPPYEPPRTIGPFQLPLSSVGPNRSKQGFTRSCSYAKLFFSRILFVEIPNYLLVDFCAVHMTADPYFILGPEHGQPLPPHLASLSPHLLSSQRTTLSFLGTLSALHLLFNAGALALALLPLLAVTLRLPCAQILLFRAHPWHLPSISGSFTQVLDRGLTGFWGAWWHQTFRFGFAAPTQYLLRHGHLTPGTPMAKLVSAFFAFATSGFLHASASYSTVPAHTQSHLPPLFFLLAGLGTILQSSLSHHPFLRPRIQCLPRLVRRAGNLAFVLAWMWLTSWALVDDFSRSGLWLFEPVPVSVLRACGYYGPASDRRVWRVEGAVAPRWYWGDRWWEWGVGI